MYVSLTNDWNILEGSSIEQGTELDNLPVPIYGQLENIPLQI